MLNYINDFEDVLTRQNQYGHFTSSSFVLNKERTKVLMVYHKIYNSWAWVGGHSDGDSGVKWVPIDKILEVSSEQWVRDRVYAKIIDKMKNNTNLDEILFCIRSKEPYKGLYNFVGGKVEENETNDEAAYRELFEETGISHNDIELDHFMDLNYFKYENNLQVYYGVLKHGVDLIEEKNKLEWVTINLELLDNSKFAGNYNILHIIRQIKVYLENGIQKKVYKNSKREYKIIDGVNTRVKEF